MGCWRCELGPNRLLTNGEHLRRRMTEESHCIRCGAANESSLHFARGCSFAKGLWILIIPIEVRTSFFSMSLNEWLLWDPKNAGWLSSEGVSWPSLFSIVIWSLWNNRNDVIFNGSHSSIIEVVKRSFSWAKSVLHAFVKRNATLNIQS